MLCQVTAGTAVEQQNVLSQSGGHINPTWVLLGKQLTVDVLSNRPLLNNISKSDRALEIFSTGGRTTTTLQGELPGYGTVWFHPGVITNILSLSEISEKYRVSYNITGENKFLVYLKKGNIKSFTQCERCLFYSKMAAGETLIVNTVDYNISKYPERDYTRDLLTQKLQYKIDLPSHRHLVKIVEDKVQMLNCPLNRDYITGVEDIWGKNLGCLKGKTPIQKRHKSESKF